MKNLKKRNHSYNIQPCRPIQKPGGTTSFQSADAATLTLQEGCGYPGLGLLWKTGQERPRKGFIGMIEALKKEDILVMGNTLIRNITSRPLAGDTLACRIGRRGMTRINNGSHFQGSAL